MSGKLKLISKSNLISNSLTTSKYMLITSASSWVFGMEILL